MWSSCALSHLSRDTRCSYWCGRSRGTPSVRRGSSRSSTRVSSAVDSCCPIARKRSAMAGGRGEHLDGERIQRTAGLECRCREAQRAAAGTCAVSPSLPSIPTWRGTVDRGRDTFIVIYARTPARATARVTAPVPSPNSQKPRTRSGRGSSGRSASRSRYATARHRVCRSRPRRSTRAPVRRH